MLPAFAGSVFVVVRKVPLGVEEPGIARTDLRFCRMLCLGSGMRTVVCGPIAWARAAMDPNRSDTSTNGLDRVAELILGKIVWKMEHLSR